MRKQLVLDLSDCTPCRQTLLASPAPLAHVTLVLAVGLLGTAVAWAALTPADLIVRAAGRVRPVDTPTKVFYAIRGEVLSASTGGRVVEVRCREGDEVRKGALLIRLETDRLDNEIAKQRRQVEAAREEVADLQRLERLTRRQREAARAKAEAELAEALQDVAQARKRQEADVRLAEVELAGARDEEDRLRQVVVSRAAAPADLARAVARRREAQEKLARAALPVDEARVRVTHRALELIERDHAVRQEELALKRAARQHELEATRIELANRELERKQADIHAPADGVIARGDVKVGDLLEPGKPVLEIAAQKGFLFEVAVPSAEVGHLKVGMAARIKLDAYDYQRYGTLTGTVCFLSPDSGVGDGPAGAAYTVRIAVDGDEVGRGEFHGRVKLGMSGQAEIVTGRESLLALLLKRIRQTISLG
jgi:multidrug efflux pump subunit AcrA (membrane-fusion protein)